jgi:hypothetical protein
MKFPSVPLAAALFTLALPAAAEIIGVESFDYPNGALAGKDGGTFWDYQNTPPAGRFDTASTWINLNGTPNVTSGQLVTSGNGAVRRAYNGSTETTGAISDANVAKTVFYKVNVTTGPSVGAGDYFGISSMEGSAERFYFGKRGVGANWGVEQVGESGTNGGTNILANTTYTVVAQIDLPGNRIRLYVNPNLSATQSANTPTANQAYTGTAASTAVRFAAGTAVTWDNLVVATTWEELQVTVVTKLGDEDEGVFSLETPSDISLREAVNYSPNGSLIIFAPGLSGQTIALGGAQLGIDKALTIDASGLPGGLTVDANHTSRHFDVLFGKSLTLRGLTLTGGNAGSGGSITNVGTLTLTKCTLTGNSASGGGGAITNIGNLKLTHCTLTGNFTSGTGGAIYDEFGTLSLNHCTLSGNRASHGGALYLEENSLTLHNTIIAGNAAPLAPDVRDDGFSSGAITGVNLLGELAGSTLTAGATIFTGDAKLSPLGHFGGPVQTLHPLVGSPAIDAADSDDPGGTDARGFARFVDGDANFSTLLDIGAVEAGFVRTVTTTVDENNGAGGTGLSLREAFTFSTAPGDRIRFSENAFPATITLGSALTIPTTSGLFIDASNLSTPVTISGNNASRVFNIPATATVATHSLKIVNGKALNKTNGSAGENGGGILNLGSLSLFSSTVSSNAAGSGGFSFSGGGGGGSGGGIFSTGPLALTACTLSGNTSGTGGAGGGGSDGGDGGDGGGISSSGPLTLTACTLSGNATGDGGGSFNIGGNGGNGGSGGGIVKNDTTPYRLISCTIAGNRTGSGAPGSLSIGSAGAGGGVSGGFTTLENCLFSLNTRGLTTPSDLDTSITYIGANVLSIATANPATGPAPTINATAHLAPLGDYGGPTQTMALRPGSPARNAATGSTRTTDQRGFPLVGAPDIGAYEAGNALFTNFKAFIQETLPATSIPGEYDASFDFDGDGTSNELEWLAGTGVNNPASAFRLSLFTAEGDLKIIFSTITGRTYRLEQSTTLLGGSWSDSGLSPKAGNNALQNFIVTPTTGPPRNFYRVGISQP